MAGIKEKIENYIDELYFDLRVAGMPDDRQADLFARVQENFFRVFLEVIKKSANSSDLKRVRRALEQEDFPVIDKILSEHPSALTRLEKRVDSELEKLKMTIIREQENA